MSSSRLGFDISLAGRAPAKSIQAMRSCNTRKEKEQVPQKAASKPSLGRESVSV
jgi:hypothetical protein